MSTYQNDIDILILAAGSSSRLGKSKQLLPYEGLSLLKRSVSTALETGCNACVIVGARAKEHSDELKGMNVDIVNHPDWEEGMGSSLKAGLRHLIKQKPNLKSVIVMVCDQPKLHVEVLRDLIKAYNKGNQLVASSYNGLLGVPALFGHQYFDELLNIRNDQGARRLIKIYAKNCASVEFPEGISDVDTQEDYDKLISSAKEE